MINMMLSITITQGNEKNTPTFKYVSIFDLSDYYLRGMIVNILYMGL